MQTYKMRAECAHDLAAFMVTVPVQSFRADKVVINGIQLPDMVAEFTSSLSLKEIKAAIADIEDGHVMLETVALQSEYTGKRGA